MRAAAAFAGRATSGKCKTSLKRAAGFGNGKSASAYCRLVFTDDSRGDDFPGIAGKAAS